MNNISEHDRAVLNSILSPCLPFEEFAEQLAPPETVDKEAETELVVKAKEKELEAIKKANLGLLDESMSLLTDSINASQRASAYNNRAQVYRLKSNVAAAMEDLEMAINLSKSQGLSACQALCQRGILHRQQGNDTLAIQDFEAASKLGSQFAKTQLVQMNPYAAMCNQMLNQIMQKKFNPAA